MQCSTACYWIADRVDLYHDINVGHYGLSHILVTLWSVQTMSVMCESSVPWSSSSSPCSSPWCRPPPSRPRWVRVWGSPAPWRTRPPAARHVSARGQGPGGCTCRRLVTRVCTWSMTGTRVSVSSASESPVSVTPGYGGGRTNIFLKRD